MNIMHILSRGLFGGGAPDTETLQRQICTLLQGHQTLESDALLDLLDLPMSVSGAKTLLDQAAQILVNRSHVEATQNNRPIDPVNANGPYTLRLIQQFS